MSYYVRDADGTGRELDYQAVQDLWNDNLRLVRELDAAKQEYIEAGERLPFDHPDSTLCPTWHDGCHCSVETLRHNIQRAETAEKQLDSAKKMLDAIEKQNKESVRGALNYQQGMMAIASLSIAENATLRVQVDALKQQLAFAQEHDYERREAHAMLTGKFETGWVMAHPDGVPDTELGKAAMARNKEIDALRQSVATLTKALQRYLDGHKAIQSYAAEICTCGRCVQAREAIAAVAANAEGK